MTDLRQAVPLEQRDRARRPGRASSRLSTSSSGLAERNWKPRSRFAIVAREVERAQRRAVLERGLAAQQDLLLLLELRGAAPSSGPSRGARAASRRRRGPRGSARLPSPARRARGSTDPAGCGTAGSRNARTTCTSASAFRYGRDVEQGLGAGAGRPRPAMSANSTVAGTCLRGLNIAVSASRRGSGTREMPTSPRPSRGPRAAPRARSVISWKRVGLAGRGISDECGAEHRGVFRVSRAERPGESCECSSLACAPAPAEQPSFAREAKQKRRQIRRNSY